MSDGSAEQQTIMSTYPTLPAPPPVCRCSCGVEYAEDEWLKLPLLGTMPDGEGGHLELRNCACGSTRAILLLEEPLPPTLRNCGEEQPGALDFDFDDAPSSVWGWP